MTRRSILLTAVSTAICIVSGVCIWGLAFPPAIAYVIEYISPLLLIFLASVNVVVAIVGPTRRAANLVVALCAVAAIPVIGFIPYLIGDASQRWFLKTGIYEYGAMVKNIMAKKGLLSTYNHSLDAVVGRQYVWGKVDGDGAVFIQFGGRANSTRHGYLYYSGHDMVYRAESTNLGGLNAVRHGYVHYQSRCMLYCRNETNLCSLRDVPRRYYVHITNNWYMD